MTDRLASWLTIAALIGGFAGGCATTTRPPELAKAERAYAHAAQGDAGKLAPVDLEAAHLALDGAERAFAANDLSSARDMAYIAERRAQLAEARADEARDLQSAAPQSAEQPMEQSTEQPTEQPTSVLETSPNISSAIEH